MKLNQIEFQDWRCFTGNQTIRFATDHGKSVTAIWGANSSGKTTILNGILWALWGTLTEDFQNPESLVSDLAIFNAGEGETLSAYVEVKFEHGGNRYTMRRSCSQRKSVSTNAEGLETHARLMIVDASGETFTHLNSDAFSVIDQILPKVLATYFFFNGEKFRLQVQSAHGEKTFADAVRQVIGLTKYERALKHIDKAKQELDVRISNSEKSDELDKLINLKNQAEHNRVGFLDRSKQLDEEFDMLKNRFDEIAIEQTKFHEIREIVLARQGVEAELKMRKDILADLQDSRTDLLGNLFALHVLSGNEAEVRGLAENHRRQKHIPADFKKSFIDDLIASGSCICGCELVEGSDQYRKVISRLSEGALEGTEESWTKLSAELGTINTRHELMRVNFEDLNGKIYSEDKAIQNLNEKLSVFDESISGVAAIDEARNAIVDLESERKSNNAKQIELTQQKERISEKLSECNKSITGYDKEIGKIEPKNEEAKRNSSRRRYLTQAKSHLEKEFSELKESLRDELEMSITTIFRGLSNNDYFAELDSDFSLKMCSRDAGVVVRDVAMGTGETQLKYYSFIAALSKLNYENSVNSESVHQSFPIMIDAPFSYLDSSLSERVALKLPTMTHQVIFLNLKRDLNTMIEPEVAKAVGAVNVLTFFVGRSTENNVNEDIHLPQGAVSYVVAQDNSPRFTKINAVHV
jgi:DNA sulfur modification protein DndD